MTKGYLTHFSMISFFHLALFLWGATTMQSEFAKTTVPKLGPGTLTLRMGEKLPTPATKKERVVVKSKAPEVPMTAPKKQQEVAMTPSTPKGHESGVGATGATKFDAISLYKAELRAEIDKNKYYPPMSRRLGQTGIVVVAFTLLSDGNIINVRLDRPSRYERLNASALEAVKKVERFKPIPKEVGENKMDITVPLKFVTI